MTGCENNISSFVETETSLHSTDTISVDTAEALVTLDCPTAEERALSPVSDLSSISSLSSVQEPDCDLNSVKMLEADDNDGHDVISEAFNSPKTADDSPRIVDNSLTRNCRDYSERTSIDSGPRWEDTDSELSEPPPSPRFLCQESAHLPGLSSPAPVSEGKILFAENGSIPRRSTRLFLSNNHVNGSSRGNTAETSPTKPARRKRRKVSQVGSACQSSLPGPPVRKRSKSNQPSISHEADHSSMSLDVNFEPPFDLSLYEPHKALTVSSLSVIILSRVNELFARKVHGRRSFVTTLP